MLEVTTGQSRNQVVASQLIEVLQGLDLEGSLYIGYPVLATADAPVTVDALLVSRRGLVVFLFAELPTTGNQEPAQQEISDDLDRLYVAVEGTLRRHEVLRVRRGLGFNINTFAILPAMPQGPGEDNQDFADLDTLPARLSELSPLGDEFFTPLQAALQRVTTIKPRKKRQNATTPASRGSVLKKIEAEIANLDQWQKRAAIESPDGPQRIRGLAGSGKTIVLALKAAYLHAQHPEWVIAVTFHTRSLYQQFEDLIRRFCFEYQSDEPDWDNLRILHAWGGQDREGVYTQIAKHVGASPRDFGYARDKYGMSQAFQGVCSELLSIASVDTIDPLYDAVLIDEAQDLPTPFFRLVYKLTRDPKRIIWAYDDLQQLSEASMPSVSEMFGLDASGEPLVQLINPENSPHQDIVLRVCYRNPQWTLTAAHACGLGIYREGGLVQHFDDPSLWTDIGYEVVTGDLSPGRSVALKRADYSYPEYFRELLSPDDVLQCQTFADQTEQARWVAGSIQRNLAEDELDHDDILVVLPNTYTAKRDSAFLIDALSDCSIDAHLAGVTSSRDRIFSNRSIALANIHRSKGNEAAVVYIVNSQYCLAGPELTRLRNTLFTAITRSRAWVRICGWGPSMEELAREIQTMANNNYQLRFSVPTEEELSEIRRIHRELTAGERARVQQTIGSFTAAVEALEKGEIALDALPLELRIALAKYFAGRVPVDNDDAE